MLPRILVLAVLGSLAWAQTGTFTVRGRVLTSSGQPLKKAEVTLVKQDQPMKEYGATSNADGQFAFENLPAGQYFARAQRHGYVMAFTASKPLTVGPGLTPEAVELKLAPQAVITGHVTDEDGDPVVNSQVELQPAESSGYSYVGHSGVMTNDLGEFRVSGLIAGRYLLSAGAERRSGGREVIRSGPEQSLQTIFYPGVADRAQAKTIEVAEGVQLHDMDIQLKSARAFKIRGKVIRPDADEGNPMYQTLFLSLQPKPDEKHGRFMGYGGGSTPIASNGGFELRGTLPGSYILQAQGQIKGHFVSRSVPVEVKDKDVDGLVVSFLDGVKLEGEVHALQAPPGFKLSTVSVYFGAENGVGMPGGNATAGADGKFTVPDLAPGSYSVMSQLPGDEGYIKSITYEGHELTDRKIEVSSGSGGRLEITVAFDTGEIDGVVQNAAGAPVPGALVAVYDEGQTACLCTHSTTADAQGRFQLKRIQPGDHFVVATSGKEELAATPESEQDPRKDGTKINVSPHSKQGLNLKIRKGAVN